MGSALERSFRPKLTLWLGAVSTVRESKGEHRGKFPTLEGL